MADESRWKKKKKKEEGGSGAAIRHNIQVPHHTELHKQ
jgi:hypothetical protein